MYECVIHVLYFVWGVFVAVRDSETIVHALFDVFIFFPSMFYFFNIHIFVFYTVYIGVNDFSMGNGDI